MIIKFKQFINENLEDDLDKALSILGQINIPILYRGNLGNKEQKIELLNYISDQGLGLHTPIEQKESLYKITCDTFTKELTDLAIKLYKNNQI